MKRKKQNKIYEEIKYEVWIWSNEIYDIIKYIKLYTKQYLRQKGLKNLFFSLIYPLHRTAKDNQDLSRSQTRPTSTI